MRGKIVIAGASALAAEVAARLLERRAGEVLLLGEGSGEAAASDLSAAWGGGVRAVASWDEAAGAGVVVLTDGDVAAAGRGVAERCPGAVVVVAADPVEEGCAAVLEASRLPRGRVVGVGAEVESLRLRAGLAQALGLAVADVSALVLGGRGERAVPVLGAVRAGGMAVTDKLAAERVAALIAAVHGGAPAGVRTVAAATAAAVASVAADERAVASCALLCQGELGVRDAIAGVPVVLGSDGVERVLEVPLDEDERAALAAAAVPYSG
ncbi:MAG: malate dehydrogenase [Solirubrobacteraceae bacterium]|jgi:malate dehydrogenase|nr:malate dehydrogenase [Solirubrobacteraceae bacterium]